MQYSPSEEYRPSKSHSPYFLLCTCTLHSGGRGCGEEGRNKLEQTRTDLYMPAHGPYNMGDVIKHTSHGSLYGTRLACPSLKEISTPTFSMLGLSRRHQRRSSWYESHLNDGFVEKEPTAERHRTSGIRCVCGCECRSSREGVLPENIQ